MRISSRVVLGMAAMATSVIVGFTALPAGAVPRPANVRVVVESTQSSTPKAKIVGEGKTAVYKPTALSVEEDTSGGDCNDGFTSFTLKNTGTATAYITIDEQPFFPLSAGSKAGICIDGGQAGESETFGLTNKKDTKDYSSTLEITFSS